VGDRARQQAEAWDRFAHEDPEYYVAGDWTGDQFYEHGRPIVEESLTWAEPPSSGTAFDLGCGLGRMTVVLAEHFDRVFGLDISPEMIRRAGERHPDKIKWDVIRDGRLPVDDASIDFGYSYNVFQHIPDRSVIEGYLHETSRVLKPGAQTVLQFDTQRRPLWKRLAYALPDGLLPRYQRHFIRRYPIPAAQLRQMVERAGLRVSDEKLADSAYHHLLLVRP
jgi:ubiquinone/menaquinone biosynthesis C-methylase UbiE